MDQTIFDKWEITPQEFTQLVQEHPSLRGFIFGYVSEYKVRQSLGNDPRIGPIYKYDDHDRKTKGYLSFHYNGREFRMEVKSLQTNSVVQMGEDAWKGNFQCDASDRRDVLLANGHRINTSCLAVGDFDLVAISLFSFGGKWRLAFARNSDLPHPNRHARNIPEEDRPYLIKSLIEITWPLQAPFTDDVYTILDQIAAEHTLAKWQQQMEADAGKEDKR